MCLLLFEIIYLLIKGKEKLILLIMWQESIMGLTIILIVV